jgi:hypothetical protein
VKTIALERVTYLPREFAPDTLYVSEEYAVSGHLCACGCGNKVVTPLGPAEWSFWERDGRPSLHPSIGSWQLPCKSHYYITDGRIQSAPAWSDVAIASGRQAEEQRRRAYYDSLKAPRGFWREFWDSLRRLLKR